MLNNDLHLYFTCYTPIVLPQLIRALCAIPVNFTFSGNLTQFIMLTRLVLNANSNYARSSCVYRIQLCTMLKIPVGGELYANYTHSLLLTMLRREHLLESKHFACPWCSDSTEYSHTSVSSLKCNRYDNGIVLSLDSLGTAIQYLLMFFLIYFKLRR